MAISTSRRRLPAALALLAIVAAGCYGGSEATPAPKLYGVPADMASRAPLFDCGQESMLESTDDYNRDGRDCFWSHNQNKEEAEFRIVMPFYTPGLTTKSGVMIVYYRTYKDGQVDIITDGRQNPNLGGWKLRHCQGLELSPDAPPAPGVTVFEGAEPCTTKDMNAPVLSGQ